MSSQCSWLFAVCICTCLVPVKMTACEVMGEYGWADWPQLPQHLWTEHRLWCTHGNQTSHFTFHLGRFKRRIQPGRTGKMIIANYISEKSVFFFCKQLNKPRSKQKRHRLTQLRLITTNSLTYCTWQCSQSASLSGKLDRTCLWMEQRSFYCKSPQYDGLWCSLTPWCAELHSPSAALLQAQQLCIDLIGNSSHCVMRLLATSLQR